MEIYGHFISQTFYWVNFTDLGHVGEAGRVDPGILPSARRAAMALGHLGHVAGR